VKKHSLDTLPLLNRERLLHKRDIVDVVSEFCDLKRCAGYFKACCPHPDHNESNPSFFVWPKNQRFKCFACDKGGDVVDFLVWVKGCTFDEAIELGTLSGDPDDLLRHRAKHQQDVIDSMEAEVNATHRFLLSTRLYYLRGPLGFARVEKIAKKADRLLERRGYQAASEYLRRKELALLD
jgi:hypothetical protein